jgi:hypothetical protein
MVTLKQRCGGLDILVLRCPWDGGPRGALASRRTTCGDVRFNVLAPGSWPRAPAHGSARGLDRQPEQPRRPALCGEVRCRWRDRARWTPSALPRCRAGATRAGQRRCPGWVVETGHVTVPDRPRRWSGIPAAVTSRLATSPARCLPLQPEATMIVGQTIVIDGGQHLRRRPAA